MTTPRPTEPPPASMTEKRRPGAPPLLIVGAMNFGGRTPPKEAERIVRRALERGLTAFDTANAYQGGESERILGRILRGRRDDVQIATKVGFRRSAGKPEGLAAATVLREIDESLRRLERDHVDVYYLHVPDHATPIEETLAAVNTLLDQGKIRSFGVSNYASWQILEMITLQDAAGRPRPQVSQVLYNLLIRQLDIEYAAFAARYAIPSAVYNPLAGGLLTGRHEGVSAPQAASRFERNALYQGRYWTERMFELTASFKDIAREEGMRLIELSYAWLAAREVCDAILIGPVTAEHLDAAIDACARTLSPEVMRRIEAVHKAYLGTETTYTR